MTSANFHIRPLAPVQSAMLRETLAGASGRYVERLEICFAAQVDPEVIRDAWRETVAATEVLRARIVIENGDPIGWVPTDNEGEWLEISDPSNDWQHGAGDCGEEAPDLVKGSPWRVLFFPAEGRWIWIFHHALLDGRSIVKVARAFMDRVQGRDPGRVAWAGWADGDEGMVAEASAF